jgi:hypothetical protein
MTKRIYNFLDWSLFFTLFRVKNQTYCSQDYMWDVPPVLLKMLNPSCCFGYMSDGSHLSLHTTQDELPRLKDEPPGLQDERPKLQDEPLGLRDEPL